MKLTVERISHLAHVVLDAVWKADLLDLPDEGQALSAAKASLTRILSVDDEVDTVVRDKLNRQRKIAGSREWQVLYDKYFQEEMGKRRW